VTAAVSAFLLTAGLVAEVTGGRLDSGDPGRVFNSVSTDSRSMPTVPASAHGAGALFIALSGPNFDAHTFLPDVIARGAAGLLVSEPPIIAGHAAVIVVDNPLEALQRLGHEVRRRSGARVVAITGSAGKTTTKEVTAACLSSRFKVYWNPGNLNNHIGLPLSLVELRHGPDVAVVELGMNHAGEIRTLVALAEPDVRVWTNVGNAHIGHFGSIDAIAEAKAEILEGATQDTVVVVNADDPLVMKHAAASKGRTLTFGIDQRADVWAQRVEDLGFDGSRADVTTPWGQFSLRLSLAGRPNLLNMLAAATVALESGVEPSEVVRVAATLSAVPRRGALTDLANGARLVDDSYNASPAAVNVMLSTMAVTSVPGRRIAVLGEMRELGDDARAWHADCGRAAARAGVDVLVAIGGAPADGFVDGAREAGLDAQRIMRFADSASAAEPVAALLRSGDLVLVKGSRGTRTDIVADRLKAVA
jgi:UDP-N-acetylmuramoyl-tripeptide--D-alanyl-D-alanine ligase